MLRSSYDQARRSQPILSPGPSRGFFLEPGQYSRVCSIVRLHAIRASVKQPNLKEILKAPVRIESGGFSLGEWLFSSNARVPSNYVIGQTF